jgi:hypothetical protein
MNETFDLTSLNEKKADSYIKYNIKNINTKTYIYCNEDFYNIDEYDKTNMLKNSNFELITDKESYENIKTRLIELIKKQVLCGGGLIYDESIPDDAAYGHHAIIVVCDNLQEEYIYSFSIISLKNTTFILSYGNKIFHYIYVDWLCSHENVNYGGEKLLNALFSFGKIIDVNFITLSPVKNAVKFYEKYGFTESDIVLLRGTYIKYLKEHYNENSKTIIYINQKSINLISDSLQTLNNENIEIHTEPVSGIIFNDVNDFLESETGLLPNHDEYDFNGSFEEVEENVRRFFNDYITIIIRDDKYIYGMSFVSLIKRTDGKLVVEIYDIYTRNTLIDSLFILNAIIEFSKKINADEIIKMLKNYNRRFYSHFDVKGNYLVYRIFKNNNQKKRKINSFSSGGKKRKSTRRRQKSIKRKNKSKKIT